MELTPSSVYSARQRAWSALAQRGKAVALTSGATALGWNLSGWSLTTDVAGLVLDLVGIEIDLTGRSGRTRQDLEADLEDHQRLGDLCENVGVAFGLRRAVIDRCGEALLAHHDLLEIGAIDRDRKIRLVVQ